MWYLRLSEVYCFYQSLYLRSFTFHPFSRSSSDLFYVSSSRQKNPRIPSLLLSLKDVNIVIVHGPSSLLFIDSEIVFACLPRLFPLAWVKMNFPLYYLLFPLHSHSVFCRSVYCSVMCILLSVCKRLSIVVFTHFVCHPLRFCFIIRILLCNFFLSRNTSYLFGLIF